MRHAVAVDIGATKVSAAIVDDQGGILARKKFPVEGSSVETLTRQIGKLVSEVVAECGGNRQSIKTAGVIVPGIYFAETGKVWVPNLWGHEQVPFAKELEAELEMPVRMDSDRAGYVLGEQWLGAARGINDVVFLAVGTGIGAGIISGGRLLRGSGDVAGAVGWFALTPEHSELYSRIGCWEAEAAGPALARRAGALSAEQVIDSARSGDSTARRMIAETARYLGMGIANLISLLNPEMIVLGGGLMQAYDLFLEEIRDSVRRWAQPVAAQQVRIEPTQLGENAGLLGAARLAFE